MARQLSAKTLAKRLEQMTKERDECKAAATHWTREAGNFSSQLFEANQVVKEFDGIVRSLNDKLAEIEHQRKIEAMYTDDANKRASEKSEELEAVRTHIANRIRELERTVINLSVKLA